MADQRTMAKLLRAPTEGYAGAIVVPLILADQFKLKHSLINMMTTDQFFRLEKDNPHDHIRWFNKITSTIKYKDVPNSAIKLMLFPTTNLRNEISNFQQRFDESFHEAWDRYKDLLRACPNHGFTELHQLDTFYNALNPADQDSLNATAGGNLLERQIAKLTHAVNQQTSAITTATMAILKQFQATSPPASVKVVEETCVTCGGAHPYYQCLAAGGNTFPELWDNIQGYVSAAAVNYNQGNSIFRPLGSGSLPSNTIANPKGKLKAITTRSGDFNGPDLAEYTIKVLPPPVKKYKPSSQREYVVHQRDPLHPNIPYPSRMLKQKQQEKDKVQIHKFWQMFKQLYINITLADALILMPKYQKTLNALFSNKEKLQELANTPLNENCSAVILKKLPEKLGDPGKFLFSCGFSGLKCKALADLGASINLMPISVWKKLVLPALISTRMTLELANRAICTPAGIARDVFVSVGKFTFPADFVIVYYESDPKVPLILGRPFLRTAHALIDVHGEEMILYQPSGNPTFSSHPELTLPKVQDDIFALEGGNGLPEKLLDLDSTKDLHPPLHDIDSSLKDSIDQINLANLADNFVDSMPEMFTDEHALDYSSPLIFDEYNDDFLKVEFDTGNVYDDPFDSKGEKIKESKLLIDELDLPCDFLPSEYDSFISQDFSRVYALPSTNNEEKVFNPSILIQEKPVEIITRVIEDKKLVISNASLVLEDFDPPFYEPFFFKEVPKSKMLLPFSSKMRKKFSNQGYTLLKTFILFLS
uniref:Reverse transcriptase domain-containing protein n=1 Tax=Tanacetum cinerariifolium TaxID=118510 RepID=A0A6L2L1P5_TANCI|nr:reverse transcriptase domain-containing protein [Tanacetum cinerariifolium]